MFGDSNVIPSIQVPSRLDYLSKQLSHSTYTSDKLLYENTILPFYLPFMDPEKKKTVLACVKGDGGKKLYVMTGMAAGGLCRKNGLYYCPICVKVDTDKYGEPYFHRTHQLEGIFVCHKHRCLLKEYPVALNQVSRIAFIRFEKDAVDLTPEYEKDERISEIIISIAEQAYWLLSKNSIDINIIHHNIMILLDEKGYLTQTGRVQQRYLCESLHRFYGKEILNIFESNFSIDEDHTWVRTMTRKMQKDMHPLRYILFANILCGHISGLFAHRVRCYVKNVPEKQNRFNDKWHVKLAACINRGSYSLRGLAKEMLCDPKTLLKHAEQIGLREKINSDMKVYIPKGTPDILLDENVKAIKEYIKKNPRCSRKDIRVQCSKHYTRLYRHDRKQLDALLPEPLDKSLLKPTQKVDWHQRDKDLLEKAKEIYEKLVNSDTKRRISKWLIIREMNLQSLPYWLEKLPMVNEFIENACETVEDYQLRRVDKICSMMLQENYSVKPWEVMRRAGLRSDVSDTVKKRIEENILKH